MYVFVPVTQLTRLWKFFSSPIGGGLSPSPSLSMPMSLGLVAQSMPKAEYCRNFGDTFRAVHVKI